MGVIKWVLALPFRLVALAIVLPVKMVLGSIRFTARTTFLTTRAAMRSSLISFAAGLGLGWFLTSTPTGRQLVGQVRDLVSGEPSGPVDDEQLTARVRTELASNTRTWHLPQPEVTVSGGVVTLTGSAPHDVGRADLEAAATSVRGVTSVVNQLTVDEAAEASSSDTGADQTDADTGDAATTTEEVSV